MTPDEIETACAKEVLMSARYRSRYHCEPGDTDAVTVAILMRALELATPDLSDAQRAGLFRGEQ